MSDLTLTRRGRLVRTFLILAGLVLLVVVGGWAMETFQPLHSVLSFFGSVARGVQVGISAGVEAASK